MKRGSTCLYRQGLCWQVHTLQQPVEYKYEPKMSTDQGGDTYPAIPDGWFLESVNQPCKTNSSWLQPTHEHVHRFRSRHKDFPNLHLIFLRIIIYSKQSTVSRGYYSIEKLFTGGVLEKFCWNEKGIDVFTSLSLVQMTSPLWPLTPRWCEKTLHMKYKETYLQIHNRHTSDTRRDT